jgi:hypothetical protein
MTVTTISVGINRGKEGFQVNDFVVTSATNSVSPIAEDTLLQFNLTDANGNNVTRMDVIKALQAFTRALESGSVILGNNAPLL